MVGHLRTWSKRHVARALSVASLLLAYVCLPLVFLGGIPGLAAGAVLIALTQHIAARARGREPNSGPQSEIGRPVRPDQDGRDVLSGTLSRLAFLAASEERLKARKPDVPLLLVIVQLMSIEDINEGLGYKAGDFALATIGHRLASLAGDGVVGRLSGSQFAVLSAFRSGPERDAFAQRLLADLSQPLMAGGREIAPSLRLGAVAMPDQAAYLTQAVQYASHALRRAEKSDQSLVVFDHAMLQERKRHRLIERELRAAILMNELELHYQPVVDLQGRTIGVEALLRWESPSRGRISPSEFIPVAESSFLIDQLGEWVLRRACLDARDFDDLLIGVNISASQLRRDDVVEMVTRVLQDTGHPPQRLILELTESVAMETTPDIRRRLAALRAMGIHIALDDFGTGFSGFDYLRHLPVDSIKIDRSYIEKLGSSEADNVLVTALASVAAAMQLVVLAEGIETEQQMTLAKAAGCKLFQGYFLAKPMPKRDIPLLTRKAA